jgi:hypothetical protein
MVDHLMTRAFEMDTAISCFEPRYLHSQLWLGRVTFGPKTRKGRHAANGSLVQAPKVKGKSEMTIRKKACRRECSWRSC